MQESWHNDDLAQQVITSIIAENNELEGYTYENETIRFHGRLYVGTNGELRHKIMLELHQTGVGGHSGRQATIKMVEQFFYWPSLKADVIKLVTKCITCQQSKSEHVVTIATTSHYLQALD